MSGTARRATAEKEWSSTELERARSDLSAKTAAERAARAEAADESARADKVMPSVDSSAEVPPLSDSMSMGTTRLPQAQRRRRLDPMIHVQLNTLSQRPPTATR